jgi:hypothetical protein
MKEHEVEIKKSPNPLSPIPFVLIQKSKIHLALIDNSTEQEKDSPFYKEIKRQIGQWEDFALTTRGRLKGSYNVYETDLQIDFPDLKMKIKGWKQQYSVGTDSWFANESNLSERTEFIKKVKPKNSKFKIFKPCWIQKIYFLFSTKYSRIDSEYFIHFEKGKDKSGFIEFFHSIQKATPSFRIHQIKMKENEPSLSYQRFISESSDLKMIFEVLEDVSLYPKFNMKA